MAEATSAISPVVTGSGKNRTLTFISTKVTGGNKNAAGDIEFNPEIIQYDNASGSGGKTIATRDAFNGKIAWNSSAPSWAKLNESIFKNASDNQIDSISTKLAFTAEERLGLNKSSGKGSMELSSIFDPANQKRFAEDPASNFGFAMSANKPQAGGCGNSDCGRGSYPTLVYPTTLRTRQQDTLRISVLKYSPRKLGSGFKFKPRQQMSARSIGSVTLPAPGSINSANRTNWGSGEMTPMQMATSSLVKGLLQKNGGVDEATGRLEGMMEAAMGSSGDVRKALSNAITENITGTTDLLSRTEGMVMNPNMELLFRGPSLRPFGFTFRLSPRDREESGTVLKIIRMFKQSMAPQTTPSSLFLKASNTYRLEFLTSGGGEHRYLPKIKECALSDFSVNFTPDGSYMTYENNSMVSYEISFAFQEIEPVYNSDYNDDGDTSIGY